MNDLIIQQSAALKPYLDGLQKRALLVGIIGLLASVAGYFVAHEHFFESYLLAFVFWVSLPLGSLAILMIHQVGGGTWGFAIRRMLEAGSRTLPLMFAFSLPILFLGLHDIYEWTHAEVVGKDALLSYKAPYLNEGFFILRTVVYFAIWGFMTYLLNSWSRQQDDSEQTHFTRRMQKLSGPGIVVFFATVTLASIDWIMSLEPHWFSSIFGVIYIIGQGLLTWAFVTLVAIALADKAPLNHLLTNQRLRDLGTFMLATVMLWAYTSFSQLLIIWSGNLPEEITWYITRLEGGWEYIGYGLIFFHFAVPFLFLISSTMKSKAKVLITFSLWLLVARFFDLLWQTRPSFTKIEGFHSTGFTMHWLDLAITAGIGGLLVAFFFAQLKRRPLIALNDPRFPELYSTEDEHGHG